MFLLGATYLALHVWFTEHGELLAVALPALVRPHVRSAAGARTPSRTSD